MDLKDIKAIIDLMKKNSVTEFELEKQDFKIRLKRGGGGVQTILDEPDAGAFAPARVTPALPPASAAAAAPSGSASANAGPGPSESDIKSPMIGTVYRAPTPEAAPYVDVGAEVGPETVVCIIEAMKVMNEIKAEVRGVVTACLIENGKPVEFGQPLFRVRPL